MNPCLGATLVHLYKSMQKENVIWFRNDLRISNNAAVNAAIESGQKTQAIYFLENRTQKIGPYRKTFLIETLESLKTSLINYSITLNIIEGNVFDEIERFLSQKKPMRVFTNKGYAHDEVEQELLFAAEKHIEMAFYDDGFLIAPHALPFEIKDLPNTFTEFRKKLEKIGLDQLVGEHVHNSHISISKNNTQTDTLNRHPKSVFPFRGGESAALERLHDYLWNTRNILRYKETRNGLLGTEYSSKFSPWLACGCISPQCIYTEIKKFEREVEANESTYWLVFELLWREYFRYVMLKYGNKLFLPGGIKEARKETEFNNANQLFDTWTNGQTGDDFVDANMRELKHTGFMSNRGRQNAASYLVHQLKLDWRRGARYFEKMLIDYDVFSNWGNWAYLAGVGNDPRENRVFNTQKQAEMYDPDKAYRKSWLEG
jgi:deoxyribodipyrimidine photo-lyase